MSKSWTCPFCKRPTTITSSDTADGNTKCLIDNETGNVSTIVNYTVCPNESCKKLTLTATLFSLRRLSKHHGWEYDDVLNYWQLIPDSNAKVYSTEIVPKAIIEDYEEACKIKSLSSKASATLSRRALQTMIRDYWDIKDKHTLKQEIDSIENKVSPKVWKAIDAVREIGNIGAHMEKDVNIIIDVKPIEAEKLIWLVEFLIERWYIEDHEVNLKLNEVIEIKKAKKTQKKPKTKTSK
jgi:hypothetical protein